MKKMQDVYYLEKSLYSTGSVIIIGNDQLKDTPAYLLSFLLETISMISKQLFEFSSVGLIFHCASFCVRD